LQFRYSKLNRHVSSLPFSGQRKNLSSGSLVAERLTFNSNTNWELCSVGKNRNKFVNGDASSDSTANNSAHRFSSLPSSKCNNVLSTAVNSSCVDGQCPAQPVLLCVREQQNASTWFKVLDDNVCTQTEHICQGFTDSLKTNDYGAFNLLDNRYLVQGWIWFFAFSALLGNLVVICRCLWVLKTGFRNLVKAQRIHRLLVLNLALSDFLMGVYILMYGKGYRNHRTYTDRDRYEWLSSATCRIMGVISSCSCQMSVTMLVIITSFRLTSVMRPFADQENLLKKATRFTVLAWLFWIAFSLIPLLPFEEVRDSFYDYVKIDSSGCFQQSDMHRDYLTDVMKSISHFIEVDCAVETSQYSLPRSPSWADLLKFGRILKIFPSHAQPRYFGYYTEQSVCSAKYFITTGSGSTAYTLVAVIFNSAAFVYILIAYCVMWYRTSRDTALLSCCYGKQTTNQVASRRGSAVSARRERENRRMQCQIIVIIVTDFMCWSPICALSIYHFIKASTYADRESCDFHRYTSAWRARLSMLTIVLLPINSSINPFVYSFRHWGDTKTRVLGLLRKFQRSTAT